MNLIFDTEPLPRDRRYAAWREAICDHYVQVDVRATEPENYKGFIKEAQFGEVVLTDIVVSEQKIRRNRQHISRMDKECHYIQLLHRGRVNVLQGGAELASNPAQGAIFSASEQYELQCVGEVRSFYLEVAPDSLAKRFPGGRVPLTETIDSTRGLGRIAADFCSTLATEADGLSRETHERLGEQLLDLISLAMLAGPEDTPELESSVRKARLLAVKGWIDSNLTEPDLSLERIAFANNMSVRYLHLLFQQCDTTVSEWILNQRLHRCFSEVSRSPDKSITLIAFEHGFNSSAHFSTVFKRKFGLSPREVRQGKAAN